MSFGIDVNILLYAPDAHLACVLRQHGIRRLYTRDRDLRRFDFLEVIDPLA